jgi:HD-GYP domain-containing protein (c-di-GMP phosphodiesterase class II)
LGEIMRSRTLRSIAPGSIELGSITFNLYASDSRGGAVLFCRQGFEITQKHKEVLQRSGRVFYVSDDSIDLYFDYAFERIDRIVAAEEIRDHEKAQIIRGVGMKILKDMMQDPRSKPALERSRKYVTTKVHLILNSPEVTNHLFALSAVEGYALSHSINVCTFSVLLGEQVFGRDEEQLKLMGLGGLLHDIGLTRIQNVLLKKPGKLTEAEWGELRQHPVHSYEIAREHNLHENIQVICRSHHEKICGDGYPDGISGTDIPIVARIAAVADTYDAMTSDRAYHKKMPHIGALGEMTEKANAYDRDVFRALLRIVLRNEKLVDGFLKKPDVFTAHK